MADLSTTGISGTDGVVPVYDPDGLWKTWSIDEIWQGATGTNKYVPKLKDYVRNPDTYETFIVNYIDPVTLIPTLTAIRPANMSTDFSETDILFGVGAGTPTETYRVYVDKSVTPYIMAVDKRVPVPGSDPAYCKIFKGSVYDGSGEVVSKVYDSQGRYISDQIPLEIVSIDSHTNVALKTVEVCHTTYDLVDNEIVTAVFYTAQGHVVMKRQLLVENTAFIRSLNLSQKYITHIGLESAFISPTDDHVLNYPLNIPINALNLVGIVYYSDGSTLRLPVNGTKFRMFGIEQYVSTIIGQSIDLVLSYALGPNEEAYAGIAATNHYITEPYRLVTTNPNNSYAVKLFGYPVWIDANNGYTMKWWLLNLDRNIWFDVTPFVKFSENTGAFNPKGYGILQRKSIYINLKDVSGSFKTFIHSQLVDIVLNDQPNLTHDPWTMSNESISSNNPYGLGLFGKHISATQLNISSGIIDPVEWLDRVYLKTYPLVNPMSEITTMNPSHFVIMYAGQEAEFPIEEWNTDLLVNFDIPQYATFGIRFIKKTSSGDLQLSVAAMIVLETN